MSQPPAADQTTQRAIYIVSIVNAANRARAGRSGVASVERSGNQHTRRNGRPHQAWSDEVEEDPGDCELIYRQSQPSLAGLHQPIRGHLVVDRGGRRY